MGGKACRNIDTVKAKMPPSGQDPAQFDMRDMSQIFLSSLITKGCNAVSQWHNGTCQGVGYIRQQVNSQFLKLMCWMQEKWAGVKT